MIPVRNGLRSFVAWGGILTGLAGIALYSGGAGRHAPVHSESHSTATSGDVQLTVEVEASIGPIHPSVYGMATSDPSYFRDLKVSLWRMGGNPATRYNWALGNCWNAARDWEFRNGNYGRTSTQDVQPSGVADQSILNARPYGADALITVPTIGWVARNGDNATRSMDVPPTGGPPIAPGSEAIAGYDPASNRQRVSVPSAARKRRPFSDPPDRSDPTVYQDEWISHLVRKFGRADAGGVRFYAMDNEPDMWDGTHTDMHPVRPDYDELLSRFIEYADAVKDVDPTAQITGPVCGGWTGYFFSPRDRGEDNFASHADRNAHGGVAFLPWFLRRIAEHDRKTGRRTLDVLDVHFYPQGSAVYSASVDAPIRDLRLRSTRALYDPTYSDESWIAAPVQLIPRLRKWVAENYPGTKIGLNEWNWGAETTLNGGLATAEVLGILGREQVDMACYWSQPPKDSPAYLAFKLFRNADNLGHGFEDEAIAATSSAADSISCFGSVNSRTGTPAVLIINKLPDTAVRATLKIHGGRLMRTAHLFRYGSMDLKHITKEPDITLESDSLTLDLPAYSLTLVRCE